MTPAQRAALGDVAWLYEACADLVVELSERKCPAGELLRLNGVIIAGEEHDPKTCPMCRAREIMSGAGAVRTREPRPLLDLDQLPRLRVTSVRQRAEPQEYYTTDNTLHRGGYVHRRTFIEGEIIDCPNKLLTLGGAVHLDTGGGR